MMFVLTYKYNSGQTQTNKH